MVSRCAPSFRTLRSLGYLQRIASQSIARCRLLSNTPRFIVSRRFSFLLSAGYPSMIQRNIRFQTWRGQNHYFSSNKPSTPSNGNGTRFSPQSSVASESAPSDFSTMTMWQRFLAPKPMPERHTFAWYREILLICTVFAITGSSTMLVGYF
jgi:hypothetical protein